MKHFTYIISFHNNYEVCTMSISMMSSKRLGKLSNIILLINDRPKRTQPSHLVILRDHRQIVVKSPSQCPTLCDPTNCSMPGLPVHHQLVEFTQTHVRWVSDAIQASHSLSSPSPPAFNLSQHWGLFKWVSSSHQVAKVLEFQLQHKSFQWIFRTDFF